MSPNGFKGIFIQRGGDRQGGGQGWGGGEKDLTLHWWEQYDQGGVGINIRRKETNPDLFLSI